MAEWVQQRIQVHQPARVHLCDGSAEEYDELLEGMVRQGTMIRLNDESRPGSFYARSSKSDVARVEERTFICSEVKSDAGPTNNWKEPFETQEMMNKLFTGCMRGRTMYVVPFCMGPVGSPFAQYGVQITDSPYAVVSMRTMTRMGQNVLDELGSDGFFVPCVHSVGVPLGHDDEDSTWPSNPDNKWIVHFPEERRIWSYGSGYGGNAILGKKCLALRIASVMAREEGWLAEHMLIVGVTNPEGVKKYFTGCFPSACGKTNMAMLQASLPGWKVECVGDDIAWLRVNPKDGRLYAINPEAGFFGVASGTSYETNNNAMKTIERNTIFTNVAVTADYDVWWEGMTKESPKSLSTWNRQEWGPESISKAAHPNSRFCVPASQCPVMDPAWENPNGVPISGILFGGRRSQTVPLVFQARNWEHGVFVGSTMSSETTAAAAGRRGVLRADPFAMKPFCGYNMADYFSHWLSFQDRTEEDKLPKIFHVNWFKKDKNKFMWPGFGDNIRVIKWIFERCDQESTDTSNAVETPIGMMPKENALDVTGLDLPQEKMKKILTVDPHEYLQEVARCKEFYAQFGDKMPQALYSQLEGMQRRLTESADRLKALAKADA